ncbi:MAG: C39 family peptidase [Candidatus Gracilibacteria bacterium]|nr:C39 family peptidase [Candidatus Gracilibacteria bacterium]
MIKRIFFLVLSLTLFINFAQAKENIITSDNLEIINYKNIDEKIRDLIQNKSLYFESSSGIVNCENDKCILDSSGIYDGIIKINTKLGEKILKTDYYTVNKYHQIANSIIFRKNKTLIKDIESVYSYAKLDSKAKEYLKNGTIFITSNRGEIKCQNEVCFINTENILFGDVSIKIKSANQTFKEIILKIKKFNDNLDISDEFTYKRLQKYNLSCEISAAADIISTLKSKKIEEDELIDKLPKSSFYDKKPISFNGQRLWGNPNDGFVGKISNAMQNDYTGYGVLEKPIASLYNNYGLETKIINKYSYNSGYKQTEHLRELLIELNKGNFVQLWGDYTTNPDEEDGTKKLVKQDDVDKGISGINYSKNWAKNRNISWNFMRDSKLYEYVGLSGEHAFYLLGYEGELENPSKIIVWDTLTGKHKYSQKEWLRKWNLMQNRSLIIYRK